MAAQTIKLPQGFRGVKDSSCPSIQSARILSTETLGLMASLLLKGFSSTQLAGGKKQ